MDSKWIRIVPWAAEHCSAAVDQQLYSASRPFNSPSIFRFGFLRLGSSRVKKRTAEISAKAPAMLAFRIFYKRRILSEWLVSL